MDNETKVGVVSKESPGAKTTKKNTNSTQNKSQTHRAKQYEVTSFLSTDRELSTETCSKNVYSLGPRLNLKWHGQEVRRGELYVGRRAKGQSTGVEEKRKAFKEKMFGQCKESYKREEVEVYDPATMTRCMSSNIDPTYKWG